MTPPTEPLTLWRLEDPPRRKAVVIRKPERWGSGFLAPGGILFYASPVPVAKPRSQYAGVRRRSVDVRRAA